MNVKQVQGCGLDHNDDDGDCISKLPDEILCLILSFLTMRDATRTRLLSQRWRCLCSSSSNLHFDLLTVCGIYRKGEPWMYSRIFLDHKASFLRGVDQFSCLYSGPIIDTFRVSFPLGNESAWHIDKWIGSAIQMEAKNIVLNLCGYKDSEHYNFPCHLLPRGERSHLKSLCVKSCLLRPFPDNANRFNSLTTLEVSFVGLEKIHFDCILYGCLNLERLKFENCWLPQPFRIHGRLCRLKTLILDNCSGFDTVELNSVKTLNTFEYIGNGVRSFICIDVPSLVKVHLIFFHVFGRHSLDRLCQLASGVPQLHFLSLYARSFQVQPEGIHASITTLGHLKELELSVLDQRWINFVTIMHILHASPLLQRLHLALLSIYSTGRMAERQERYDEHPHFHLKEVKLNGYDDQMNEREFAMYLLKNAVALERMVIRRRVGLYCGDGRRNYFSKAPWGSPKKEIHDALLEKKANAMAKLILI